MALARSKFLEVIYHTQKNNGVFEDFPKLRPGLLKRAYPQHEETTIQGGIKCKVLSFKNFSYR